MRYFIRYIIREDTYPAVYYPKQGFLITEISPGIAAGKKRE
jgi:hypothetical protein